MNTVRHTKCQLADTLGGGGGRILSHEEDVELQFSDESPLRILIWVWLKLYMMPKRYHSKTGS